MLLVLCSRAAATGLTRPGRSSEITAARHDKITAHLREAGLDALDDLDFVGLDDQPDDDPVIITGRKATRNPEEIKIRLHQGTGAGRQGAARCG
jgi:hypothetical protein